MSNVNHVPFLQHPVFNKQSDWVGLCVNNIKHIHVSAVMAIMGLLCVAGKKCVSVTTKGTNPHTRVICADCPLFPSFPFLPPQLISSSSRSHFWPLATTMHKKEESTMGLDRASPKGAIPSFPGFKSLAKSSAVSSAWYSEKCLLRNALYLQQQRLSSGPQKLLQRILLGYLFGITLYTRTTQYSHTAAAAVLATHEQVSPLSLSSLSSLLSLSPLSSLSLPPLPLLSSFFQLLPTLS